MRVVVSIQAKRSSGRGLAHYIAHSKLDAERQQSGRGLFTENAGELSVEKANDLLKTDTSRRRASNDELHHLVLSVKESDFATLGRDESERRKALENVTRAMMKTLGENVGAEHLIWTAGIHRNTSNPHVHIALQKTFFDKDLNRQKLTKIPRELLPHHETRDGEKVLANGRLIDAATLKLDQLAARAKVPEKVAEKVPPPIHAQDNAEDSRKIFARSLIAEHEFNVSAAHLNLLIDEGDKRRFKITDALTGKMRPLSLSDLRTRAAQNADKKAGSKRFREPTQRDEFVRKEIAAELELNAAGIKRIRTILHHLVVNETRRFDETKATLNEIRPAAAQIRRDCRRSGTKLPTPDLAASELDMLQSHALDKGEIRTAHYLERIRAELAAERGTPMRSDEEIASLKARRTLSEIRELQQEKRRKDFHERRYVTKIETPSGKTSLFEIDKGLREEQLRSSSLGGKLAGLIRKGSGDRVRDLSDLRELLTTGFSDKESEMASRLAAEKLLSRTLTGFFEKDDNPRKESIPPKFGANELAAIEAAAIELKLPEVFRENFEGQKSFLNGQDRADKEAIIAGRALARETLTEIEAARSRARLTTFQKNRDFEKFSVPRTDGSERFVSLAEVRVSQRNSMFDQALGYIFEDRENRQTRRQLETLVKEKLTILKSDLKNASALAKLATTEARPFQTHSILGPSKPLFQPIFTPEETIRIDRRINETTNRLEARRLTKTLAAADGTKARSLVEILTEKEHRREMQLPAEKAKEPTQSEAIER